MTRVASRSPLLSLVEDPAVLGALLPRMHVGGLVRARAALSEWLHGLVVEPSPAVPYLLEQLCQLEPERVVLRTGWTLEAADELLMAVSEALGELAGVP